MASWYDPNWKYRQKITLSHVKAAADLSDFTVAIEVIDPSNPIFARAMASGYDLVVTADDGVTELSFERSIWNPAGSRMVLYVRVPFLSAAIDTAFYIYYGYLACNVDRQSAASAWDGGYEAVYHFEELPASGLLRESLGLHHGLVPRNTTHTTRVDANGVGSAWHFDGTDFVQVTPTIFSPLPAAVTVEIICRILNENTWGPVLCIQDGAGTGGQIFMGWANWYNIRFMSEFYNPPQPGVPANNADMYYVSTSAQIGDFEKLYLNAAFVQQVAFASWHAGYTQVTGTGIGGSSPAPGGQKIPCIVSEIRVSRVVRQPAWMQTTYNNIMANSSFFALAPEEPYTPPFRPINTITPTAVYPDLPGLTWSATRTPIWRTLIQESESGREVRAALWSRPRWKWALVYDWLPSDEATQDLQALLGFFLQRRGAFESFLFLDPEDQGVAGQFIGTGDGATRAYQMQRTLGGYTEPIYDVTGVSTIYLDGVAQDSGWEIDAKGGLTFTAPPGAGVEITADFSYYWRVRFAADECDFETFAWRLWDAKKVELMSVKA